MCFGQETQTIKIAGPELYKLNSTMRADLGGRCRLYVPLNIPENAVYCYVTISTASGNESQRIAEGVDLFAQISSEIPSVTAQSLGALALLSDHILNVYQGSVVDVGFLPSVNDAQLFLAGRGGYRLISQFSRTNYNGGTISSPTSSFHGETIYIGLTNNSSINSVWVNVEAVVVTYTLAKPSNQTVNASNYTNLGWESYKNGSIDKCIEYSQKALTYDSTNVAAMLNLGLCHLIKNEEVVAIDFYMNALALLKLMDRATLKYYLEEAIKDIEEAKEDRPEMIMEQDILTLFKVEYEKQ
jgi:tetratricopeptide (TPR) repeat protein